MAFRVGLTVVATIVPLVGLGGGSAQAEEGTAPPQERSVAAEDGAAEPEPVGSGEPTEEPAGQGEPAGDVDEGEASPSESAAGEGSSVPSSGAGGADRSSPARAAQPKRSKPRSSAVKAKDGGEAPDGDEAEAEAEDDETDQVLQDVTAERRDGFMIGTHIAGVFGGASGYPNDANKIDQEAYYTNTGVGVGVMGDLWIGGALSDWLTFGAAFAGGGSWTADHQHRFFGIGVHIDLFPAWALGGPWQDIGMYIEPGVGFAWAHPSDDPDADAVIDSGGASRLAFGVFYEGVRFWQISLGPFVGGDFIWSGSALRPAGLVGLRTMLYAGP